MDKNDRIEESIRFVARHFSPEAFSRTKAWRRLGISAVSISRFQLRRSLKYAAVGIGVVALTASAILLINRDASAPATEGSPAETAVPAAPVSPTLRFNDTPLTEVVKSIEQTYGVRVTNIPAEEYRLTGVYEGTADDILATINDLLGTNLEIEK